MNVLLLTRGTHAICPRQRGRMQRIRLEDANIATRRKTRGGVAWVADALQTVTTASFLPAKGQLIA